MKVTNVSSLAEMNEKSMKYIEMNEKKDEIEWIQK